MAARRGGTGGRGAKGVDGRGAGAGGVDEEGGSDAGDSSARDAGDDPGVVDRADFDPGYDPAAPIVCEICGAHMVYTGSCKIACRSCGYLRDCSDP